MLSTVLNVLDECWLLDGCILCTIGNVLNEVGGGENNPRISTPFYPYLRASWSRRDVSIFGLKASMKRKDQRLE